MLYSTLFFQQSLPLSFLFQTLQLPFYYSLMINLNPFKDIECKSPNRRLIFPFIMTQLLVILALVGAVLCANSCQAHIANLTKLFVLNRPQFIKQVHGYVIYSGKMINDLGFPDACHKYPNYRYFTGEVHGEGEFFQHRGYLGVCFSKECNQTDINQNAALIVNTLLNISIVTNTTSMNFTEPSLEVQTTAGEIVFLALFLLLVACSLKESVFSFFKNCKKQAKKEDEELYGKYAIQFGDDYDPNLLIIHQNQGFFKKYCLPSKMHEYLSAEQSSKIVAFSAIRILAVPLALYGYLFYLANIGSYNYNAFAGEIYSQSYSKIAVSAYYIPDILFFISGFLLAKKAFMLIEVEPRAGRALIKLFYQKVFKWLPIYWAAILIYWQITPALHAGPVWYEYQSQAAVCNSKWWQSLLFIDNWFQNGCYNFAWYIPAQIQLSLLGILLLWIYQKNQKVGFSLLIALFLATWIITLTISAPFPTSLDSTLSSNTITYFKSTYSHMPYYLLGIINGYLGHHQKMKEIMQKLTRNKIFRVLGVTIGMVIMSVIVIRPSVWQKQLNFELGLAKTGMFLALYLLIFWSMFGGKTKTTVIHRIATLSKGVMLIGGIVVASFYWGGFSFPYLDQNYLLRTTITNLTIAIPVGGLFIAMFSPKPKKEEQPIL